MLKNTFKTIYVWMNSILFEWIKWPIMELIWGGFFLHWEVKSHWEEFSSDMIKERHAVVARKKLSNKHFSFKCKKNDKLSLSKLQLYVIAWKKTMLLPITNLFSKVWVITISWISTQYWGCPLLYWLHTLSGHVCLFFSV